MALTLNGKHTGRAAVTELHDFAEQLREQADRERHNFMVKWRWNLRRLKRLDPDWEAWYDKQPEQTLKEMLPLIMARIEAFRFVGTLEIHIDTFWVDNFILATEQDIEAAEQWLEPGDVFIGNLGRTAFYADMEALKRSNRANTEHYVAFLRSRNNPAASKEADRIERTIGATK